MVPVRAIPTPGRISPPLSEQIKFKRSRQRRFIGPTDLFQKQNAKPVYEGRSGWNSKTCKSATLVPVAPGCSKSSERLSAL